MNPNLKFRSQDPPVPTPSCPTVWGYSGWVAMGFTRCHDGNAPGTSLPVGSDLNRNLKSWFYDRPTPNQALQQRSSAPDLALGQARLLLEPSKTPPWTCGFVGWVGNRMCTAYKTLAREHFACISVWSKRMTVTYFAGNVEKTQTFGQSPSCLKYTTF